MKDLKLLMVLCFVIIALFLICKSKIDQLEQAQLENIELQKENVLLQQEIEFYHKEQIEELIDKMEYLNSIN